MDVTSCGRMQPSLHFPYASFMHSNLALHYLNANVVTSINLLDETFVLFNFTAQVVLNNATVETDNPDLRDRAYIYWRLLSTDPEV